MKKFSFIVIFIAALFLTGCSNSNVITEIDYNKLEDLIKNEETFILETELKHFQKLENIQTIVKWLFFCQFLYFYLAYILRTLYNRDIKVG